MRAERWKDRSRPIGRPPQDRKAPAGQAGALRQDAGPAINTQALPVDLREEGPATPVNFGGAAAPSFVRGDINLSDLISTIAPRRHGVQTGPPAPRSLHVAPPPAKAPVFIEPNVSVNVLDLKVEPHLTAVLGSDELSSERYRTLAVRLINLAAGRKLKTLLVTSAQEGEGKSTVATNLAWVMAKSSERRVLLLDADLRYPSVGRLLGLESSKGWLDMADGRSELADTAIRINPNGLYIMTPRAKNARGKSREPNPDVTGTNSTLTSSRVEKLIRDLEHQFDYIIIDAPPILEFADAQRLASIVDGVVFVARAAHTPHNAVTDALKLVPKDRRLGVVLNESQIDEEIAYHNKKKKSGLARLFGGRE